MGFRDRIKLFSQKTRQGIQTVMVNGRYAGSVVDKKTLKAAKNQNKNAVRKYLNVEPLTAEGFEEQSDLTEAINTLKRLDDAGNVEALNEVLEDYKKSDFLKTNKAMEFLAAHRYEKTLPEGWTAEVVGQNNSHVPDILVRNEKGELQYSVEVKMPLSQALPIVLSKDENGLWAVPEDADEYTQKRVAILNKPENLALQGGAEAVVTDEERTVLLDLFEQHLTDKGSRYLYVVNPDKKKDAIIDSTLITEDSRVSLTLRIPRAKSSGSSHISAVKFDTAKAETLNVFHDGEVVFETVRSKKRAMLYTDEQLDSKSARRYVGESFYVSGGSHTTQKKLVDGVEKDVYVYEIRERKMAPTSDKGYTSLGQLSIKVD
jgi:hypothetical protein